MKIKIAVRLRPRIQGENDDGGVQVQTGNISVVNPRDTSQLFSFPFSSCYDGSSTQEEIFVNDVQPMIDVVFTGVTITIFAYGVTSSGKTHTMQGTPSDLGVIPRVVKSLFEKRSQLPGFNSVSFSMSYFEIYVDEVFDLLTDDRQTAPKLPVRENEAGQAIVANLSSHPIESCQEFTSIYARANKNRSVGSTNLNNASSRSHSVLTIEATMVSNGRTLTGKVVLVDLAGSENNKLTGNDPSRMKESSAINRSLSVLGQVVHDLNKGASRIPYRNSKLTRILSGCLGGKGGLGLLVCNLAPSNRFRQDTLNTLNFASRTRNLESKPVVNEQDSTQPLAKPHFAAIQPQPSKVALNPQPVSSLGAVAGPSHSRSSLAPSIRSRVPRRSIIGTSATARYQPFGLPSVLEKIKAEADEFSDRSLGVQWSEKEFEERISKAVEMEVTRRLEERERELKQERHKSSSPKKEPTQVIDFTARLEDLEKKYESSSSEHRLSQVLSPRSKKKAGRAYVSLAREHSERGDLEVALELYRKAESYVPDNKKLKERIIELEWSVKQGETYFVPSPKKRPKTKTSRKIEALSSIKDDYPMASPGMEPEFGRIVTNSPGKTKRTFAERDGDEDMETPLKRQKRSETLVYASSDDA